MGGKPFAEQLKEELRACRQASTCCDSVIHRERNNQKRHEAAQRIATRERRYDMVLAYEKRRIQSETLQRTMLTVQGHVTNMEAALHNAHGIEALQKIMKAFGKTLRSVNSDVDDKEMQKIVNSFSLDTQKLHFKMSLVNDGMVMAQEAMDEANEEEGLKDPDADAGPDLASRAAHRIESRMDALLESAPSPPSGVVLASRVPQAAEADAPARATKPDDSDSV